MEYEAPSGALKGTEMSEPMNVTAAAERSDGRWSVEVPEIPGLFTQTRRLDQIDAMRDWHRYRGTEAPRTG